MHEDFIFLQGPGWGGVDFVPGPGTLAERRAAVFQEIRRRRVKVLEQLRKDLDSENERGEKEKQQYRRREEAARKEAARWRFRSGD